MAYDDEDSIEEKSFKLDDDILGDDMDPVEAEDLSDFGLSEVDEESY